MNNLNFKKIKEGDYESLNELISPIKEKLYRIAYIYVGNEHDALDCLHDSIIKAITSINTLKDLKVFNTWITRILINTCKNFLKKCNKRSYLDITSLENSLSYNDPNFIEIKNLYDAIAKLKDKEKELILLRYIDDKDLKSIALEQNVPIGTVKSRLNRTLKKLKLLMGDAY